MSQRRFHSKSRLGCVQCKKNRTKCDERRPACGRCRRIGMRCSLVEQGTDSLFIQDKHGAPKSYDKEIIHSHASTTSPRITNDIANDLAKAAIGNGHWTLQSNSEHREALTAQPPHLSPTELLRLRLLHQWTMHTSHTFADIMVPESAADQTLWTDWVVTLALQPSHAFLLHGLLSISALHLALLSPDGFDARQNTVTAITQHDLGVAVFQPHIASITVKNYDAVFPFWVIIAFHAFALHRRRLDERGEDREAVLESFHTVLSLIRGSSTLAKLNPEVVFGSRWAAIIPPVPWETTIALSDEVEAMLSLLRQRTTRTDIDPAAQQVYLATLPALRYSLTVAQLYGSARGALTLFVVTSPPPFWPLFQARQPLALAIVAAYAVSLHRMRANVWIQDWGRKVVQAVQATLDPEWRECIAWAVKETNGGGKQ